MRKIMIKGIICVALIITMTFNSVYESYATEFAVGMTIYEVAELLLCVGGAVVTGYGVSNAADEIEDCAEKAYSKFEEAFAEAESIFKPDDPKNPKNQFEEIYKKIKKGFRQIEIPDELWGIVLDVMGDVHEESSNTATAPSVSEGLITGSAGYTGVKHGSYSFSQGRYSGSFNMSDDVTVIGYEYRLDSRVYITYILLCKSDGYSVTGDTNFGSIGCSKITSSLGSYYKAYSITSPYKVSDGSHLDYMTGVDYYCFRKLTNEDLYSILHGDIPDDVIVLCGDLDKPDFDLTSYMKTALDTYSFKPEVYDIVNNNTSYVDNDYLTNNRIIDIPNDYKELLKSMNEGLIGIEDFLKHFNVTPVFKVDDTDGDGDIDSSDRVTNKSRTNTGVPVTVVNNELEAEFYLAPYSYPKLKNFFPFCLPWDMYAAFTILCKEPQAPCFNWTIPLSAFGENFQDYDVNVDLSPFDELASTCRKLMLFSFCFGLIMATKKFL